MMRQRLARYSLDLSGFLGIRAVWCELWNVEPLGHRSHISPVRVLRSSPPHPSSGKWGILQISGQACSRKTNSNSQ